jgi:hypothetical protein
MNKTDRVAAYFQERPNRWISALPLMRIGGLLAWRTEVSRARKKYRMRIVNEQRAKRTRSYYKYETA